MWKKLFSLLKKPGPLPLPRKKALGMFRTHFAEDVLFSVCHSNIMDFLDDVKTITKVSKEKQYLSAEIKNRLATRNEVTLLAYLTPSEGSVRLDELISETVEAMRELVHVTDFYSTDSTYYSRHAKACMFEYQELLEALKRTGELYAKHQKSVETTGYSSR